MKDIVKHLTVNRLEMRYRMEGKYLLGLGEPGTWHATESTLTLTAEDMIRFYLDPNEDLVGATLEVTLKPVPFSWQTSLPDTVKITRLVRSSEVEQHYSAFPLDKSERRTCLLEAQTPVHGGTLVILPSTYYELKLRLTEDEYRRLRALPAGTALQVRVRQTGRGFRDLSLKYRGILDSHRVFPKNYAGRMITLARAMIALCDGDVDYVGHYCGLEIHEERESDATRLTTWHWRREYFAVKSLSPKNWERAFANSVTRVDAILKERYRNRLPSGPVHEFYDNIETSTWQSKKPQSVDELSVGLEAKYVFRKHCHLPSVVIEARSVAGNRKACEAACEALCREAAALFKVRFDHLSLAIEEYRSESKVQDQPGRKRSRKRRVR